MGMMSSRPRAVVIAVLCVNAIVWSIAGGGATGTAIATGTSDVTSTQSEPAARVRTASRPVPAADIRRGIVVVGDSISARYDDRPGSDRQAWWSLTARHFGAPVRVYAQSGSGYLRPGQRCTGNRFRDRGQVFAGRAPAVVLLEGGRNDWARCVAGRFVRASDAEVATAVDAYLDELLRRMPRSTRIVVLGPPWGPLQPWEGRRITSIVHTSASRHGLQFVSTEGTLDSWSRVVDGVHPDRAGSTAIADRVVMALAQPALRR